MAKGGGKSNKKSSGGGGGRSGGKNSGGGGGGGGKKSSGRVSGRSTPASAPPAEKGQKKFGQMSRKERDMMEEYGELVPQDFDEDESDRIGSFRKVVKESELDYQSALKRERELESESEVEEDEYKLDRPSAFNKLVGILKKTSKRKDEWKKRKLEEEGLEDMDDEDEDELEVEEEVVTLTEAERKELIKKHGKGYLQALDGEDMDDDDEDDIPEDLEEEDDNIEAEQEESADEEDVEAIVNEDDSEGDSDEEELFLKSNDNFDRHFSDLVTPLLAPKIAVVEFPGNKWKSISYEDPVLKRVEKFDTNNVEGKRSDEKQKKIKYDLDSLAIKQRIQPHWAEVNESVLEPSSTGPSKLFSPLQQALVEPIIEYRDILFTNRSTENSQEIRNLYSLHALNHVFKTRDRILKNSGKLQRHQQNPNPTTEVPEFRDQGFTRPKVLIILPFKNTVVDVVESLIALSGSTQQDNRKRFFDEFGADEDIEKDAKNSDRPADFLETFKGNIDDHFRVGIKFTRKTLKLYSDFYSADIILASPLGLKTVIGAEGDKKRDYDFLSSIEVVIVDQTDDMLMQNWDHLETVFEHMNLTPKDPHGCDFSRLRNWALDGRSKYVRQTLLFSNYPTPEINALFKKYSRNVAGKVKVTQAYEHGSIVDVVPLVQQNFTRIETRTLAQADDNRFQHFITQTLPQLRRSAVTQTHTMIYVPSYFDFVRLRNYFTENKYSFAAICEYTTNANVSRARSSFFHGEVSFLLYTERFHYFRRYNIRGTFHLTFYGLPEHAQFYPEMLNLLALPAAGSAGSSEKSRSKHAAVTGLEDRAMSCTALFTKYDLLKLQRIVGTDRANSMCKQEGRDLFVFT
ncbi:rRNA-binding ribosome biosynthesis protein utp25 [Entomortierella beljakovae]|nr:rRNA-binding ribosome biosynthesis protein utp25 [Entomortierella beljakovae]